MTQSINYLLIGELAKQANTTKDTIRHYNELGLLKSRKRQAGSRFYTEFHPQCIERIRVIKIGQNLGYTLSQIALYLDDHFNNQISIEQRLKNIHERLEQAKEQQRHIEMVINTLTNYIHVLQELKSSDLDISEQREYLSKMQKEYLTKLNPSSTNDPASN
ncbi:helix-turn-helix domain-containing protein [Psychrobacter sp. I-STPA10]|uniref:helix-turn-helix domain-containing protein n=1 Tax=Psychrobacter sp. I-STPA10 TaxID=2585769 RepID=UPI001E3C6850|nr:MerR family transcriptional regulator [Psychrobacter sp. I-STPA10]